MAKLMVELTREEVHAGIPYKLICETMCGAVWQTSKRRRRWAAEFTEKERNACYKLKAQAYRWHLTTGVPDGVKMSLGTLALWKKLEDFCASL